MKFPAAIFTIILAVIVTLPEAASAQDGLVSCTGLDCNFCSAVTMAHNIGKWLVGILILIATIMLAVTGVQMAASAGNSDAKQLLKERLQNIIIGFILILASVVIIDTLMKALVTDAQLRDYWNTPIGELCATAITPETGMDELPGDPGTLGDVVGQPGDVATAADGLSESEARARLEAAGIELKPGSGYAGLQPHVIDRIIAMDQACGCNITVTEATAGTHAAGTYSHANGYKLDLRTRNNTNLINYVQNQYSYGYSWSDGTSVYVSPDGKNKCAVESTHMDCQFIP